MDKILSLLPRWSKPAVDALVAAGFDPLTILSLLLQYGPQILAIVQQIIAVLKQPLPPVPAKSCSVNDLLAQQRDLLAQALAVNVALTHPDQ